jgi:hypothetical protein
MFLFFAVFPSFTSTHCEVKVLHLLPGITLGLQLPHATSNTKVKRGLYLPQSATIIAYYMEKALEDYSKD